MALKRKPISVWDLKKNPSLLHQFTTPQLHNLLQQLNEWFPTASGKSAPPSPSLLAQSLSRGRWHEARHLEFISNQLVELEKGERERLLISTPPRHGKSELISKWFPFWALIRSPEKKIILASYEAEFAASWGRKVRNLVIEHGSKFGLFLTDDSTAAHRWELKSEGGMMTAGAAGPITGKGAGLLVIDDPIKNDEEASSKVYREKLWNWFQTTALTRLDPGGKVVIIGTRWHEDDLIGRLEAQSESGEGLPWDIIKLPAIAEEDDDLGRALGEPLWPERITLKDLETKRSGMSPYHWSSLFQQHPSPEEGGAIKRIWWKFYVEPPAEFDQMIQSWDLSFKDLKSNDYVVGQVWGRIGSEFYLIHQVRARMGAPETIAALRGVWAQYPKAVAKLVEDKANGPAVIALLNKEVPGLVPIKVKGSKEARLGAVIPLFQAGNVYVPHPSTGVGWVNDLIEECAAFPNGTHDDQCDALSQSLAYLQPSAWRGVKRAEREAENLGKFEKTTEDLLKNSIHDKLRKYIKKGEKAMRRVEREEKGFWLGRTSQRMW